MKSIVVHGVLMTLLLMALAVASGLCEESGRVIRSVRIAATINPVVARFVVSELKRANETGAAAFLLELDTPGGLDRAMRDMIQAQLGSRVPVIVYVSPAGARAASAGALITLAADFAVMAPGTNLGAAHPVSIGMGSRQEEAPQDSPGVMETKVLNDAVAYARSIAEQRGRNQEWAEQAVRESISTPAQEALRLKVIDLVASDTAELLEKLDGRTYLRADGRHQLTTSDAVLKRVEMDWRQQILNTLSDPNIAYLLLMLGILGIFFEISQPGVILPGAIGVIALLLALFAFQMLPINYVGLLLILLGVILFVLEVKVISFGMLTVGGIVALLLGSLMLIGSEEPSLQISWALIAATVGSMTALLLGVLYFVVRTQRRGFVSGREGMAGERGTVVQDFSEHGTVFVHGEYWDAETSEPLHRGDEVEVVELLSGMRLRVRSVPADRPSNGSESEEVTHD